MKNDGAWGIADKANKIYIKLSLFPNIIETLLDDLKLDKSDLTKDEIIDIGLQKNKILCLFQVLQFEIIEAGEKLAELYKAEEIEDKTEADSQKK